MLGVTARVQELLTRLPNDINPVSLEELRRVKAALVELENKADTLRWVGGLSLLGLGCVVGVFGRGWSVLCATWCTGCLLLAAVSGVDWAGVGQGAEGGDQERVHSAEPVGTGGGWRQAVGPVAAPRKAHGMVLRRCTGTHITQRLCCIVHTKSTHLPAAKHTPCL